MVDAKKKSAIYMPYRRGMQLTQDSEFQDKTFDSGNPSLDSGFKYEIANQTGGKKLFKCLQCGTCAGICPVFEVDERYDPQKIIKMALTGLKTELLSSDLIWMCATCYSCFEHCPQGVGVTDIMCAIQNIATKNGHPAPALEDKIKLLKEHARTLPLDNFDNKKRAKFNLPPIKEKAADTAKIIESTGIEGMVGGKV